MDIKKNMVSGCGLNARGHGQVEWLAVVNTVTNLRVL